jgi:transcriptional regulator GlxA family with amidase domain
MFRVACLLYEGFLLAGAGLLDDRGAATQGTEAAELARGYPSVEVDGLRIEAPKDNCYG